jgi:hypothetical protein
MARLTPAVHRPSQTGTVVTSGAPNADGDAIPPGAVLRVANANASPCVITVDTPGTVGGLAIEQYASVSVATGTTELIGPFRETHFIQTTGATKGLVHVDYSVQTSVTREVISL